jgi:hypothetical protein
MQMRDDADADEGRFAVPSYASLICMAVYDANQCPSARVERVKCMVQGTWCKAVILAVNRLVAVTVACGVSLV